MSDAKARSREVKGVYERILEDLRGSASPTPRVPGFLSMHEVMIATFERLVAGLEANAV